MLCVALNHVAASRACQAFQERRVQKSYLAIVQGLVDADAVPMREEEPVGWGESAKEATVAGRAVKGKRRKSKGRSVEYMPAHVFFQREKVIIRRRHAHALRT